MPPFHFAGPIAVIDFETTGLFPFRHDRVVEVAAVVIHSDGRIEREFVSLVNPARDIGSTRIHGLTSEDILHAPQFGEIAALLIDVLNGTVAIASHNVRFDSQFLETELNRIGCQMPQCHKLCTMQLAGGGSLTDCCDDYGIPFQGQAHHALVDARAAAQLLTNVLADQSQETQDLRRLVPIQWPNIPRTSKQPVTREESRRRQTEPPTFLQRLLGRKHNSGLPIATEGAIMAYEALLDRVLEDRHVDDSEAEALVETATRWGLSRDQIRHAHSEYLNQLAVAAVADAIVTDAERRDLKLVARLLGQENRDLDSMLDDAAAKVSETHFDPSPTFSPPNSLIGKNVCFTGELQHRHKGETISRELAEELAARAGLVVATSVTKKLDLLVVADPHTQSGKMKKAKKYGIQIMHESVFWKAIGVQGTRMVIAPGQFSVLKSKSGCLSVLIFFLVILFIACGGGGSNETSLGEKRQYDAWSYSRDIVRECLKHPHDADFNLSDAKITWNEEGDTFFVISKVKAKNDFGGQLTYEWATIVFCDPEDKTWKCVQCVIDGKKVSEDKSLVAKLEARKKIKDDKAKEQADKEAKVKADAEAKQKADAKAAAEAEAKAEADKEARKLGHADAEARRQAEAKIEAAAKAKRDAEAKRKKAERDAAQAEKDAAKALAEAKDFMIKGPKVMVRPSLEAVISKYPFTAATQEARRLLKELK